jgi:hypothetical protein
MKPLQKIKLINDIGKELQKRMTFTEIDSYFQTYGIPTNHTPSFLSKYVYVKEVLPKVSDEIIIELATELEISHNFESKLPIVKDNSTTFWKAGHFKLFISHLSSFKKTVSHLKISLEKYGISAFVAHEDIEPAKEWQDEIEKGLFTMDALCAVLMPGFKESNWTDQEIGVAIGRGVLIIPIKKECDPYGFIGKYQGLQAVGKNIDEVATEIFEILTKNPKTRITILNYLINLFLLSNNEKEGLERIRSISKINSIPLERINYLTSQIIENKNLKTNSILIAFNDLIKLYGQKPIIEKSFDKINFEETEDLPF